MSEIEESKKEQEAGREEIKTLKSKFESTIKEKEVSHQEN
jgi:hypothetical protein